MPKTLTSVKVDKDVYELFKEMSVNNKFYLQDLVNRSLDLFTKNQSFRDQLYNHQISPLSSESQAVIPSISSQQ